MKRNKNIVFGMLALVVSVTSIGRQAFSGNQLTSVTIQGKISSSEFTTYYQYWGWASGVTCVKDNTSNVTNGCITWGAS